MFLLYGWNFASSYVSNIFSGVWFFFFSLLCSLLGTLTLSSLVFLLESDWLVLGIVYIFLVVQPFSTICRPYDSVCLHLLFPGRSIMFSSTISFSNVSLISSTSSCRSFKYILFTSAGHLKQSWDSLSGCYANYNPNPLNVYFR